MERRPVIVWFRKDLRLSDHPALGAALATGARVIPVYIHAPDEEAPWQPGAASRWWLHQSLSALEASLRALGSRLVVRRGPTLQALRALVRETGATAVHWTRRYEPAVIARDAAVKRGLRDDGVDAHSFGGALLHEPWEIATGSGTPYRVFTPFWKRCLETATPDTPTPPPRTLPSVSPDISSLSAADLGLLPSVDWAAGLRAAWSPGEAGAQALAASFAAGPGADYADGRDLPAQAGTSRLSPHLTFGELSARQAWHAVASALGQQTGQPWLRQLYWREFSHHLLYHYPDTPEHPLDPRFAAFPWADDPEGLAAWQRGRTGFPIIDAGMRELWTTGWMHNRVRMLVASFLTKDLRIAWQHGAAWFWDTLVDADLANNTLGWQWAAGCGADAAPYFRVFNPTLQSKRYDPDSAYVARWVPELAALPPRDRRSPWEISPLALASAGVTLGASYPAPVVDHAEARQAALAAYEQVKAAGRG
ncbi:MAG: deoxyribodipyrimidine photo-lyase [Myxococcota bacterium]